MATDNALDNWLTAWPDALAFVLGLAVARWAGWNTGDLVWSLWLSSLVVGYATIVWMICQPAGALVLSSWRERALMASSPHMLITLWLIIAAVALFFLGFFTVHFVGFHYVHSQILISFFPISGERGLDAGMATYTEIVRRYWIFLPSAFLAHRTAFLRKPLSLSRDMSIRSLGDRNKVGDLFSEPYRNVLRMHFLLFFFLFAHFARVENFAMYAVVYAVYFFPWRLVRRPATPIASVSVRQARVGGEAS